MKIEDEQGAAARRNQHIQVARITVIR